MEKNYLILPPFLRMAWGFVLFLSLFLIGPAMQLVFGAFIEKCELSAGDSFALFIFSAIIIFIAWLLHRLEIFFRRQ